LIWFCQAGESRGGGSERVRAETGGVDGFGTAEVRVQGQAGGEDNEAL